MIRLRYLVTFAKGNNPTWNQADVVNWSNIEINVGILCSCMPTMRIIIARIFPRLKLLGSTKQCSEPHGGLSHGRSGNNFRKGGSMDDEIGLTEQESIRELELYKSTSPR